MPRYSFHFGAHPDISAAELAAVFSLLRIPFRPIAQTRQWVIVEGDDAIDPAILIDRLGGIVKIGISVGVPNPSPKTIAEFLTQTQVNRKIIFSLSGNNAENTAIAIKRELKSQEKSVRYIRPKNAATILHNNLLVCKGDLAVLNGELFATVALQPFEQWGERDYGRPRRDAKAGMLPPKLARMMINLARVDEAKTILDPFCGSGTILAEALLMGYTQIIGSDASAKAIEDTKKNIAWMQNNLPNHLITVSPHDQPTLFVSAVQNLEKNIKGHSVDAIITEPSLGPPLRGRETKTYIERIAADLSSLYTDAFSAFRKILRLNGTVTFVIPSILYGDGKEWINISKQCVPQIAALGFKIVPLSQKSPSLSYGRENQRVLRNLWQFIWV